MKFNPNDWWQEPGLRAASLETRGAWIDILCLMWKSPHRGMLEMPDGCPPDAHKMHRILGCTVEQWTSIEAELYDLAIASKSSDGRMMCRRMMREATEENEASEHARKAAEARWRNAHKMPDDAFRVRESESPRVLEAKKPRNPEAEREPVRPTPEALAVAELLDKKLRENYPNLPTSKLTGAEQQALLCRWALDFDRFGRIDEVTQEQYRAVIEWATADTFWRRQVQSPGSLRTRKDGKNAAVWVQFAEKSRKPARSKYDD
jgi:uncharacterized protein YdaU (DUF1376 family)